MSPELVSGNGASVGAVEMTIKTRILYNSVKALIVTSFNEGHQGKVCWNGIYLEWVWEGGPGGGVGGLGGMSSLKRKNNV